jgi:hypothetical protein
MTDSGVHAWELADQLGRCELESRWTREDATRWWQTRMEPEAVVTFGD